MAFINFIETFFFISLAITFILIIMLVYHFKDRLKFLEQKNETMFEILNNIIKEMKNIKQQAFMGIPDRQINMPPAQPVHHIMDTGSDYEGDDSSSESSDEDSQQEIDEEFTSTSPENNFKKIIVEDILEEPQNVEKVDIIEESTSVENVAEIADTEHLEEINVDFDSIGEEGSFEGSVHTEEWPPSEVDEQDAPTEEFMKLDYKKLDISVLRAMVSSRGLIEDAKKTKKSELIKMLQNADKNE